MRAAPPVSVECGAGAGWRAVQGCLHAGAAVALLVWARQQLGLGAGAAAFAVMAGLLAFVAGWLLAKTPTVRLCWTGEQWTLRLQGQQETPIPPPTVAIDLGHWMLLRAGASARHTTWLALGRRAAGAGWLPLRAAVYSAAPELTLPSLPERAPF
jgi:hypothetical protein